MVLFGALFLGIAMFMGRAFAASRDRSERVLARVTGFRIERSSSSRNSGPRTFHYAQFVVVGGVRDGIAGESRLGSGRPLYDVDEEVNAFYDPQTGAITGEKGEKWMKVLILIFTFVGTGIILAALFLV